MRPEDFKRLRLVASRVAVEDTQEKFAERLSMTANTIARMERGERAITDRTEMLIGEALEKTFTPDQIQAFLEARRDAHIFASEDSRGDVTLNAGKLHFEILITPPAINDVGDRQQYWAAVVTPCSSFAPQPNVIVSEDYRDSDRAHYLSPFPMGVTNIGERIREAYYRYVTQSRKGEPIVLTEDVVRYDAHKVPLTYADLRNVVGAKTTNSATIDENSAERIRVTVDTVRNGKPERYYWIVTPQNLMGWVTVQINERRGAPDDYYTHPGSSYAVDPVHALHMLSQLKMKT